MSPSSRGDKKLERPTINSVHEEYEHIAKQHCQCGGTYRMVKQMLIRRMPGESRFDSLRCKCVKCGAERCFTFDVAKLFCRYGQILSDQDILPERGSDETD